MSKYVVIMGDLMQGYTFHGTFDSSDDAVKWATDNHDWEWYVADVKPVDDIEEDNYMSMKAIWKEADELCQDFDALVDADFDALSDADIVDLRDTMQERCERIRQLAGVNLTDEDVED